MARFVVLLAEKVRKMFTDSYITSKKV